MTGNKKNNHIKISETLFNFKNVILANHIDIELNIIDIFAISLKFDDNDFSICLEIRIKYIRKIILILYIIE